MSTDDVRRLLEAYGFRVTMASEYDGEVRARLGAREVQLIHVENRNYWWALASVGDMQIGSPARVAAFENVANKVMPLDAWIKGQAGEAVAA